MSDEPTARRLSGDEVRAVRFASHRQLARWTNKARLSADQHTRRNALKRAASVLRDPAFADGCELHPPQRTGQQR
jgi:hypothetical protein